MTKDSEIRKLKECIKTLEESRARLRAVAMATKVYCESKIRNPVINRMVIALFALTKPDLEG